MGKVSYENSRGTVTIELDGPVSFMGTALGMRALSPSYELGFRDVSAYSNPAGKAKVSAAFTDLDEADRAFAAFSADMSAGTPGTLRVGSWEQRAYIEPPAAKSLAPTLLECELTCVLLDGVWRRPMRLHMFPQSGDGTGTKSFAYTYPYSYSSEYGARYVQLPDGRGADFRMEVFGAVESPSVKVGENIHSVGVSVPPGARLTLDSRDASAVLTLADGTASDVYGACERGTGEGCGRYAWQRIPAGLTNVAWDNTFGFDLTVFEERETLPFGGDSE